ncbi:MAG: helix-turn-helix domain-containing protein [Dehalococcoidales bacterium]
MFECTFDYYIRRINEDGFSSPVHSHTCFELVYYFDNGGFSLIDGKKHNYNANDFVIIEPGARHDDHSVGTSEIVCVGFNYDGAEFLLKNGRYRDQTGKVKQLLELLTEEMASKLNHYAFVTNMIVKQILIEIERLLLPSNPEAIKHEHIKQALNYIQQYYLTEINMEQLAAISQYSYHRFRHIFKEEMGISPKQYILHKRLMHAKQQLQETSISVTELAYNCGFASTSQFIKQFKAHFKTTPTQYKKLYRENYIDVDSETEQTT